MIAWFKDRVKRTILEVIISGIALSFSLFGWFRASWIFDPAWFGIILCGIPIIAGAVVGLVRDHDIKADVLVAMALIACLIVSEWFAAGEVAFIMQIGTLLEDYTAHRARKGIEALVKLTPRTARVRRDGQEIVVPTEEVLVDDVLTVLAGETVPVDGAIISGEASIDQSVMTGESIPVDKHPGDEVTSGTVNRFGTFDMRATSTCDDSSLQRMIALAEQADADKAPIVSLADRWASWLVVIAFSIALLTGILTHDFIRAVTVLVVFCPCAFVLATPTAVAAGIGNATRYGIIIRSGDALERLSKVTRIAFDKTGTLTYGKPQVIGIASCTDRFDDAALLRLTASAEQRSEHPLGKAIVDSFAAQGGVMSAVTDFTMQAGKGVSGIVEGHLVQAGRRDCLDNVPSAVSSTLAASAADYLGRGATVIFVSIDGQVAGIIALADTPRRESAHAIARLKDAGITPVLLTGDNSAAAHAIADEAGIDEVHAELLPEDKMDIIRGYEAHDEPAAMIGDGVNDALALSTAFAGIAMGGIGSDIAVESSDAVLVSDDVERLPYLIGLCRKTMRKVSQNIVISMCINAVAIALSIIGILDPVTGALMHNCGSVFVVVNAATLLGSKDTDDSPADAAASPRATCVHGSEKAVMEAGS